jgi:hypothetical protein
MQSYESSVHWLARAEDGEAEAWPRFAAAAAVLLASALPGFLAFWVRSVVVCIRACLELLAFVRTPQNLAPAKIVTPGLRLRRLPGEETRKMAQEE